MSQNPLNSHRTCTATSFLSSKCEKTSEKTKFFFEKFLNFSNFCRTFLELFFRPKKPKFFVFSIHEKTFHFYPLAPPIPLVSSEGMIKSVEKSPFLLYFFYHISRSIRAWPKIFSHLIANFIWTSHKNFEPIGSIG